MFPSMVARRCSHEAPTGTRPCLSVCLSVCLCVCLCMSVCACLFVWQSPPLFVYSLIAFVLYDVTHYMSKYVSISDWNGVEISTLSVRPCPLKVNGQVRTHTLAFWKVNNLVFDVKIHYMRDTSLLNCRFSLKHKIGFAHKILSIEFQSKVKKGIRSKEHCFR